MATLLLMPEKSSTTRSGIARHFPRDVRPSDEIVAFLPLPAPRSGTQIKSSEAQHFADDRVGTTPDLFQFPQPSPLVRLREPAGLTPRRFKILQQWEGVVVGLGADDFTAELRNLTLPRSAPEMAEFPYSEISDSDRFLVQPGAVFYWIIGYDTTPGGQIRRMSEIRLKRSPEWNDRKLETIATEAEVWYRQMMQDGREATP